MGRVRHGFAVGVLRIDAKLGPRVVAERSGGPNRQICELDFVGALSDGDRAARARQVSIIATAFMTRGTTSSARGSLPRSSASPMIEQRPC